MKREMSVVELEFAKSMKSVARNLEVKEYIQHSDPLFSLFQRAAKRFVAGETRDDALMVGEELLSKGYRISLEFIGENTTSYEACVRAKEEFLALIAACRENELEARISFDLSHIGLLVDLEFAEENLRELAQAAEQQDIHLMISMEESSKTDDILAVYKNVAFDYTNVGVTIQAHLHRSKSDLETLLLFEGPVRIVKGAYEEPEDLHIARSDALNERYVELVRMCVKERKAVSIASHDEDILSHIQEKEYFSYEWIEAEFLYGIRPELSESLKADGAAVRIYLTYGSEWYLYLVHRIAEYPPNIYQAFTDLIQGKSDALKQY
ncbi:proline dehydrogenase family protein [Geomicrobium sp. JCM 19055]|uniref:proline dehydrogenase family protein n=1 Tax=Geomicrobium sp. JCM 19055 TaxID=1460649 RepID=UPI00045ED7E2|nr:proline dehydrogenase family protein [Geomicrobium sp. JCM 19055]GAJ98968.1 proline dehydrogenase [Geomicrobium sp. JCM 19055]